MHARIFASLGFLYLISSFAHAVERPTENLQFGPPQLIVGILDFLDFTATPLTPYALWFNQADGDPERDIRRWDLFYHGPEVATRFIPPGFMAPRVPRFEGLWLHTAGHLLWEDPSYTPNQNPLPSEAWQSVDFGHLVGERVAFIGQFAYGEASAIRVLSPIIDEKDKMALTPFCAEKLSK